MSIPSDTALQALRRTALAWAEKAAALGWLSSSEASRVAAVEHRSPESLFDAAPRRPLVVAFFGGTGVGKSTLLNRLAGQAVARTGVVRPTSREISVYLHRSVRLKPLPSQWPLDRIQTIAHDSEAYRDVLWVDMPDFDSTDQANHALALQWLPHIDVLIYVVSPERYRDDRGWQILLQHQRDHAWLFVINQWDRGHPAQSGDFERLLAQGGFDAPLVFRTDSRPEAGTRPADDFDRLAAMIREFSDQRTMEQLTRHNLEGRYRDLADTLQTLSERFGDGPSFERLRETWNNRWNTTATKLRRGLQWPMDEFVTRFVSREADPLRRAVDLEATPPPAAPGPLLTLLWDDWAQLCFEDALDQLLLDAEAMGLPPAALREDLERLKPKASRWVLDFGQTALREALARPGTRGQRWLLKLVGLLAIAAPLGATGWVAYEVVVTYYHSVQTRTPFLGTEFAIHSGLLIAVAWLFPYAAQRKLKPSAEKAARRGLARGLEQALEALRKAVDECLQTVETTALELRTEALGLIEHGREAAVIRTATETAPAPVARTLARARR